MLYKNPEKQKKPLVVHFAALPYITAKLHLGRLMGTSLPADILKRYNKEVLGKKTVIISGLDCYGTSVYKAFKKTNQSNFKSYVNLKQKEFYNTLSDLGIDIRYRFNTTEKHHRSYVNKYFEKLKEEKRLFTLNNQEHYCEKCNLFLADRLLETKEGIDLETFFETLVYEQKKDWISKMDAQQLYCIFCKTLTIKKDYVGLYVKYIVENTEENSKQINRPFLNWGLKSNPSLTYYNQGHEFTYYVWVQALLSYPQQYQRIIKNYNVSETKYFYGKDNLYYHQTVYPNLLLKTNDKKLISKSDNSFVRNYVLDENCQKLSSSKNNFLTLETLNLENKDLVRFSLAYEDCLNTDSVISTEKTKNNCKIYINKFVNGVNRVIGSLKKFDHCNSFKIIKNEPLFDYSLYHKYMTQNNLRCAIEELLKIQSKIAALIDQKIKTKTYGFHQIYNEMIKLIKNLSPFTPKTSKLILGNIYKMKKIQFDKESLMIFK